MAHPTEDLLTCWGDIAPIDVDLVPLMEALWSKGVKTNWCCQEHHDGKAIIGFPSIDAADRFCRQLLDSGAPASRVAGPGAWKDEPGSWTWRIHVRFPLTDRALPMVSFPRSDLAAVTRWAAMTPDEQAAARAVRDAEAARRLDEHRRSRPWDRRRQRRRERSWSRYERDTAAGCARCGAKFVPFRVGAVTESGTRLYLCAPHCFDEGRP